MVHVNVSLPYLDAGMLFCTMYALQNFWGKRMSFKYAPCVPVHNRPPAYRLFRRPRIRLPTYISRDVALDLLLPQLIADFELGHARSQEAQG